MSDTAIAVNQTWTPTIEARFEPIERLCAGRFGFVCHRFPIKGGITLRDVLRRLLSKPANNRFNDYMREGRA